MALDQHTPIPIDPLGKVLVRQDDHVLRATAISIAVNPPDEQLANWIQYLRLTSIVTLDSAGILGLLNEELTDYAAHRVSTVFHAVADGTNTVPAGVITNLGVAILRANQLKVKLRAHMLNAGGAYHNVADTVNESALGLVPDATDAVSLRTLVIVLKARFNAHRAQAGVHQANDTANVVTTADAGTPTLTGPLSIEGDLAVGGRISVDELNGHLLITRGVSQKTHQVALAVSDTLVSTPELYDVYRLTGPTVVVVLAFAAPSSASFRPRIRVVTGAVPGANILIRATLADEDTLFTFPAASHSWGELEWSGTTWVASAWGGGAIRGV